MGRKKLEMKRIEDKSSRQVAFTKRRGGLFKKARELSVLCDVEVALVIFSSRGKLYEFTNSDSVSQVVQRYQSHYESKDMASALGPQAESRFAGFLTSSELLQIVERQLEDPHLDQLSVNDIVLLEDQIDAALIQLRSRKTQLMLDSITALQEKENLLRAENKRLVDELGSTGIDRRSKGKMLTGDLNDEINRVDHSTPQPMLQLL